MTNTWFRMYAEFATDPKVQILPEVMQRRLMMLFCMRVCNDLVTLQETEIAFQLRISDDELKVTKTLFVSKGFIDDEWNVVNWDKRQFRSDSSAERVAKFREKKKLDRNADVTLQKRNSNALEQIQNRTDTEQIKPAKRVSQKKRMPENFEVSERVKVWATEKGHTRLDEHLESFISKAKAAGYKYVDWDEALINAIRDNWAKLTAIGAPQRAKFASNDWMRDDVALDRKASELGVRAYPGEDYAALRQRVISRAQIQ